MARPAFPQDARSGPRLKKLLPLPPIRALEQSTLIFFYFSCRLEADAGSAQFAMVDKSPGGSGQHEHQNLWLGWPYASAVCYLYYNPRDPLQVLRTIALKLSVDGRCHLKLLNCAALAGISNADFTSLPDVEACSCLLREISKSLQGHGTQHVAV